MLKKEFENEVLKILIPVRCFSCDKFEIFSKRVEEGEKPDKVLDDLQVKRWCCRRMIISHIDLIDEFLPFT
jgi:DNA-directed RNA polymerase subunit N